MSDAAGSESWTYNAVGRVTADTRVTNGVTKTTTYSYFDDGSINSMAYPFGDVVTYAVDSRSLPLSATDTTTSGHYIYYASQAAYTAPGELASLLNGPTLLTSAYFNDRLQPCRISVNSSDTALGSCTSSSVGNILDISYNFNAGAGDNGNVMSIANNIDNLRSQTFTYDTLNRLLTAQTASTYSTAPVSTTKCWGEAYSYDPWGNLLGTGWPSSSYASCTQETPGPGGAVLANNQLSADTYDAAGNITAMPNGSSYSYDAENHLLSTAGVNYTYDGDGNRVEKSSGTIYWHGGLDESNLSGTLTNEYIFFGGARIARRDPSSNVFYNFADHLGTARSIAEVPSGQTTATKCYDADLYPFGGERWYTDTCDSHYKFTGKERDPESGLDNFGARYNSSSLGRFMSPDPGNDSGFEHPEDPQSWDAYAYGRNNPLTYTDPDGRRYQICIMDASGHSECTVVWDSQFNQLQQNPGPGDSLRNGVVFGTDANGNQVQVGTYSQIDVDLPGDPEANREAAGMIVANFNSSMKNFGKNAVYAVIGAGIGQAIGTGLEALQASLAANTATEVEEITNLATKAASTVGNQGAVASNEQVALAAAQEFLGPGATPIRAARGTGAIIGEISADGQRVVRYTSINKASPYINLENKLTGGNLHVRF